MIKINFLSSFKDATGVQTGGVAPLFDEDERKQLAIAIAKRILILVIGPAGLMIYEVQTIPVLQKQLSDAQAKHTELKAFNDSKQGSAEEIIKYQDEQSRYNAQMDFINKIQADKVNEYKLFKHLKDSTPPTVWVNSLSLTDNVLQITGESIEATEITQFQEKLSNSDFIMSLVPLEQKTRDNAFEVGVTTTSFQVKATLKSGAVK